MVTINLFINSPAYYTQEFGIIDEVYDFCKIISSNINVKNYTTVIDTIGITPIIAPENAINEDNWCEEKKISLPYRMASISLHLDYDSFCNADIDKKKELILRNILSSLSIIKMKLRNRFNYTQMEMDILNLISIQ